MDNDGCERAPQSQASERPRSLFRRILASNDPEIDNAKEENGRPTKWSMGVLNDPETHEVPGMNPAHFSLRSVLILKQQAPCFF